MELLFSYFIKYILLLVKAIRLSKMVYTIITVSKIRIRLKINSALVYIEALGIPQTVKLKTHKK